MYRRTRYYQRNAADEEFETPALRAAVAADRARGPGQEEGSGTDSEAEDQQSESGLGSAEEDQLAVQRSSGEDSDAPEAVQQSSARLAVLEKARSMEDTLHSDRLRQKERRRRRDQLFKQQKEDKMAALKKRKLPEHLLQSLTDMKQSATSASTTKKLKKHKPQDMEEEEEASGSCEDDPLLPDQDFLPVSAAGDDRLEVVSWQSEKHKGGVIPESVSHFKRGELFGARIKRATGIQMQRLKAKKKAG